MKEKAKSGKKSRIRLLHQYYKYTGFYGFIWESLKKAILPLGIFLLILFLVDRYVLDIQDILTTVTTEFAPIQVLSIFFASESLLGLIPPELFIAWAGKSSAPFLFLTLLAAASYAGGIVSYFIGVAITKIKRVHDFLELRMSKHVKNTRKWGGFLIVVGALLPIPFSVSSIASGMIRFPFSSYLIFALLRFARFYLYSLVIFEMI